jgi:hypothetical protein
MCGSVRYHAILALLDMLAYTHWQQHHDSVKHCASSVSVLERYTSPCQCVYALLTLYYYCTCAVIDIQTTGLLLNRKQGWLNKHKLRVK